MCSGDILPVINPFCFTGHAEALSVVWKVTKSKERSADINCRLNQLRFVWWKKKRNNRLRNSNLSSELKTIYYVLSEYISCATSEGGLPKLQPATCFLRGSHKLGFFLSFGFQYSSIYFFTLCLYILPFLEQRGMPLSEEKRVLLSFVMVGNLGISPMSAAYFIRVNQICCKKSGLIE